MHAHCHACPVSLAFIVVCACCHVHLVSFACAIIHMCHLCLLLCASSVVCVHYRLHPLSFVCAVVPSSGDIGVDSHQL